uniref:Uncharacterized protein n=1 Tax=Rhizophora mucronata TaxID=61149 RepID=A0A2P2PEN7_RHIMU
MNLWRTNRNKMFTEKKNHEENFKH